MKRNLHLIKLFILLTTVTVGSGNVWGWCGAKVNVLSEPSTGGYVYANTSNSGSASSLTNDNASNQNKTALSKKTFDFYLFANAKSGYTFKGWSTSQSANSGNASSPYKVSLTGNVGVSYTEYTYYAIFARLAANMSSTSFGNVTKNNSSTSTQTITINHSHAGTVSISSSSSDFTLSKTSFSSTSEGVETITVTFKPGCKGTRNATITVSSNNGLSSVKFEVSGTGVAQNQKLSWNNESSIETNMLNGATQTIAASSTGGLTVSYSSDNSSVLSVDANGKLTAKAVGSATITASQGGDGCTYNAATSITKTFQVKTKDTPFFNPNGFAEGTTKNLKVGDKVTLGVQYVSDGLSGNFAATYNSSILKVTRDGNTITIEALNEGSSNAVFTQTETAAIFGASKTYSFTVSKIANTLTADATHSMLVDAEPWTNVLSSQNSNGEITTTSSDETVAYFDKANNRVVAPNSSKKSFNSKEVTITINQAATYKYTAASKTITLTVNKHDNHISINGTADAYAQDIYMDGYASIYLTANNTDYSGSPISNSQTEGSNIATFYQNQNVVYSSNILGMATWTLSQAENYKYKAANATFTIHVVQQGEATDCYVLNDANERSWSTISNSGNYNLSGQGTTLLFQAKRTAIAGFTNTTNFYAQYSTDGTNWTNALTINLSNKDIWYDQQCSIPLTAKYVRFATETGATGNKQIRNVRVTRYTYLNADNLSITTDGTNPLYPNETGVGILPVNYSFANGGDLKVKWDNAKFTINGKTSAEGLNLGDKGCSTGSVNLSVNYAAPNAIGSESTKVVIYNNVYRKEVTITATVVRRPAVITWNPNTSDKKNHGEVMTMEATSNNADYTNYPITFTSSNTDFATVDGNQVTFLAAGAGQQVTITANQPQAPTYTAGELVKTFTIKSAQVLSYRDTAINVSIGDDQETADLNTLLATHTGDGDVSFAIKSGNQGVLSENILYGNTANEIVITATASNTANYETVSTDFTITVKKRTPDFTWQEFDHIYSGQVLTDVASVSYKSIPVDLEKIYTHVTGSFVVDGSELHVDKLFTTAHEATVRVTTSETEYYAQTSDDHIYYLESKKLPKFYLNGEEMRTDSINNLVLKIGETANVEFDQVEESEFTYTTTAQFVSYEHDSENHSGVITATAFGNEGFLFSQNGTTTVFQSQCQLMIKVNKHEVTLSSPINDSDVWMVDSIYTGIMYEISDDGYTAHAQEEVIVESSDESVLRHLQDGSWKAVGAGTATLTIRQLNNGYWTGDTITRVIKVQKYTPEISWNIENEYYAWGSYFDVPVVSSNTDVPFTVTSSNTAVANYIDGHIYVYNKSGEVTFTFAQEGNYKWNAASTNLTKYISVFQPQNHVPFTLSGDNYSNYQNATSGTVTWNGGYKIGNGGINTFNKNTSSVTIHFTGVPDKLSFTKTLSKYLGQLPGSGDCNCYVYESADGSSWSECWKDVERVETKTASNIQLQPTTRYLKFEYEESCVYCTYSNINVTERRGIEPAVSNLDFSTGYNGNTATKRSVNVSWFSVLPCQVAITGTDANQFYLGEDSKTISSELDNSGDVTLNVYYKHEENKLHNAILTITSADNPAYAASISLAGTTECAPQEIIWRDDITPLPHNGGVYEGAAWASSNGAVVLTSDDESIIKVVGNGLQPVAVGTTTIRAYQAGDGIKWAEVNAEKEIEVTSLSVQHLVWNDQLNNVKHADGQAVNITLTAQSDAIGLDSSLVVAYELDDAAKAFASLEGNQLTVTGWGSGYIVAKQVGNANFVSAQLTKKIISRNPDADCKMLAGEYTDEYTLHTIASKEIDITNGEPASIEFDAKMDISAIGEGLHVDEYYGGAWHEVQYIDWAVMAANLGSYAHYGPYNMHRNATKVKLYTNTGATMTRTFKNVEITLARYLELAQNDMSFASVDRGSFLDQTFYINYSNLRGTLDVELKNASSNLQVITETVGEECGEIGQMVAVTIRCNGVVVGTENNTIVLSNKEQSLEVPVTATVVPASQNITWNPETNILTTATVDLDATCTSNLPITYSSNNEEVATVQKDGSGNWSMTIVKDGQVTITASQAGNGDWSPAQKDVIFTIAKATPTVTVWGTPSEVTKWSALSTSTISGGEASVLGTFAWQDGTTSVARGNSGYPMVFVPTNSNWYNTVIQNIVVPVAKDPQTITWNYTPEPMFCNAQVTFDATASSELNVRYESSDANIAYVNGNKLVIISGGEVTITAVQDGDDIWAKATLSKDLTILRWTPKVITLPVANSMLIGQHLDNATLIGGVAKVDNKTVDGSFSWKDGSTTTIDVAGNTTRTVIFTPSNPNHYNSTTCEVEVDVKKYAPTITNNLSAQAITYGQALSESNLTGSLVAMDNVKYPAVEVEGSYAWKTSSLKLNAGNRTAVVCFTPNNLDWYDVVDVEIPVLVNKAQATAITAISSILYGQILEEAVPQNTTPDAVSGVIEGTMKWDLTGEELQEYPTIGIHDEYPVTLTITDPNYINTTISGTCILTVEAGYAFDGHNGTTSWSDPLNWKEGSMPKDDGKVIVMANAVIINTEVIVGALTIKNDVNVTIEDGGKLNVGEYDCVKRVKYGNMIVKEGGQVNLKGGEVALNDLFIQSSLGGTKTSTNEHLAAKSGQIDGVTHLHVNGSAYFDVALDANGACTQGWYTFTVPFPVNATSGVQRFENGVLRTNLKCETNYAIMDYHEDIRAEGKYGWKKYHGIMQPGKCYTMTIDDYHNVYRFVKTADGALNSSNTYEVTATIGGAGGDANKGWNCVGNGTCNYANIAIEGISKVQIYDHATNSYSPVDFTDKTFVVGSAFYLQAPQTESILYSKPDSEGALYAPNRGGRSTDEFMVTLSSTNNQSIADQLYLSASEDATDTYEIGHDLSKFGVSSTVAQMWCSAYGMQLCDVELPLVDDNAIFPIEIYAPKAGRYSLSVEQTQSGDRLFLLHNGTIVTELTTMDYSLQLEKGTNKGYELQLVAERQIPTDIEETDVQSTTIHKVVINNKLYILNGDNIYDAIGNLIK